METEVRKNFFNCNSLFLSGFRVVVVTLHGADPHVRRAGAPIISVPCQWLGRPCLPDAPFSLTR